MTIAPVTRPPNTGYRTFAAANPGFMEAIASLRRYRTREFAKLAALDVGLRRDRVRKLLRCQRLALTYAFDAMLRLQRLGDATPDTIRALASLCDPFKPSHEPVDTLEVPRTERRPAMPLHKRRRTVQNFGPLKRMHQMLVADVLVRLHPPRPDQFLYRGGMPAALAAVEGAFRDGYSHAVEVDMSNFYGNLRLEQFAHLLRPLPERIVNAVVWDFTCRRDATDWDHAGPEEAGSPSRSGLVGLSLGAATSPIVGEIVIRHLLDTANLGPVTTYADNVLVLGRDRRDTLARAEHLVRVGASEAGPLRPRIARPVARFLEGDDRTMFDPDNAWGVEFSKQIGTAVNGSLSWAPIPARLEEHQIADILDDPSLEELAGAEVQVSHWRRSYPLWADGDAWEAARLAELASARYYRAAQPEHRTAALHALIIACLANAGQLPEEFAPEGATDLQRRRRAGLLGSAHQMLDRMALAPL